MAMDKINLSAWEDRTDAQRGGVSRQVAAMAQATLGGRADVLNDGDPLPPLWHWFGFSPITQTSDLGKDGHPKLGGFLPDTGLDRRMWAGGELSFHGPVHIGEDLERRSKIRSIVEKTGAAGRMVFVTVDHQIHGDPGLAVSERHDIVYLAIPDTYVPPAKKPAPANTDFSEEVNVTASLLFRYSAITFNAHRIHYDLRYAQETERYPGLVVHGPLQATLMMSAAHRHAGRMPDRFTYRGVHPVFLEDPLRVVGTQVQPGSMNLCTAVDHADGSYQGMQATAYWEEE